ncbi:calcium-binding protein [Sulfitobacter sp.]|uniref:calcium-binding protein n=1 Tax=Sulfitobacter sp. TaxID=1903071 RepID=UPI0030026ADD
MIGEGGGTSQGGNGNDTISDGGIASGGAGDDVISGTAYPYAAAEGFGTRMSGDEGDDTLTAHSYSFNSDTSNYDSLLDVTGGEGADVFDVQITMPSNILAANSLEDVERDTFLNIVDFNPHEDVLAVQINGNEDSNVEMTSAEIVLRNFTDVGSPGPVLEQVVQMNFAATETTGTFTTWIRVESDVEITIDDIEFVAGPGVIMGDVLTIPDDGSDIIGTDGNDTLISEYTTDEDFYRDVGNIRLGDGDDLVDIPLYGPNIEGGLGNDTITFTGIGGSVSGGGDDLIEAGTDLSTLNGDEGNDTLIGNDNNNLYGGAGDDLLIGEVIDYYSGSFVIDGGAGDDTIMVSTDIGYPADAIPATSVTGGEGADSIELLLKMNGGYYGDFPSTSDTERATGISLDDFNADEDSLVIQVDRAEGNEDRVMTGAEIVTTTSTNQGVESSQSSINMYFAATDIYGEHTAVIRLGDDVNISIDDIVFIQN